LIAPDESPDNALAAAQLKAGVRCRIEETKREKQRWAPDKLQQCKMRKTELKGFFNVWV